MDVRVVDSSECRPEVGGWSHEFRFGFPCGEIVKSWPVEARDTRRKGLSAAMASEPEAMEETGGGPVLVARTCRKPFLDHWLGSS